MLSNKTNIICILHILQEYSDEAHILPMRDIIAKMRAIYGISIDRRTVYSMIEALNLLNYDISTYEENGVGYYLRARVFEPSEVRLLTDRIYSMGFISQRQTNALLEKLQSTQSIHARRKYKHLKAAQTRKSTNAELFWIIEQLDEAIEKNRKVAFDYYNYTVNKKLVLRRAEKYLVNPYRMVCANEKYYLVCNYDKYENISHYRIDMIKNLEIAELPRKPLPANFNLNDYSNALVYMFDGTCEDVEIVCDNLMAGEVIDRFGSDVRMTPIDEDRFKLQIHAPPHGLKFWALQYLPYCEIVAPAWLREEIKESIRTNRYGD
ncbi:MAG: WYL domain-containing protein [Clostridiales Family XIII bacterium]|jgi:predicted DNA-binding transcriptional regulator YafY|nr:WYL domain-containing protein [Clostridiales Family XIII bacterium]